MGRTSTHLFLDTRRDASRDRYVLAIPVAFVDKLAEDGWCKGSALRLAYLRNDPGGGVVIQLHRSHDNPFGAVITLRCRGERFFFITLPRAIVDFFGFGKGEEFKWEHARDRSTGKKCLTLSTG